MRLRTLGWVLLASIILLGPTVEAEAQVIRPTNTWYLRAGAGPSVSETDIATYAIEPYSIHGEVGYQLVPWLSAGLGVTYADYPEANPDNSTMTTLQGLGRWTLFPEKPGTPYFNFGAQLTLGGDNLGGGPVFGLGVDYVVSRRVSLFAEATAYATLPDDGIDGRDDGRATFDGLGFWGAGVRASVEAAPHPPVIESIGVPEAITRGNPASFTVRLSEETDRPIDVAWTFGDGDRGEAVTAENAYPLPGEYTVEVEVTNAAGTDRKERQVEVQEPAEAAQITAFRVDSPRVSTQERVTVGATVRGTQPVEMTWDFGDGTAPVTEQVRHQFEESAEVGYVEGDVTQAHSFAEPGTYTVTLTASNRHGTAQREATIDVTAGPTPPPTQADVNPCREAQVPDTVYFEFDESFLRPPAVDILQSKIDYLERCPQTEIRLSGYADWVGPESYNEGLSQRRAEAVRDYFIEQGLEADRFVTRGFGELSPPCPEEGRGKGCQAFRRVESVIVIREAPSTNQDTSETAGPTSDASSPAAPGEATREEAAPGWSLVVASLRSASDAKTAADQFRDRLTDAAHPIEVHRSGARRHRVVVGSFPSGEAARNAQQALGEKLPDDTWLWQPPAPTASPDRGRRADS